MDTQHHMEVGSSLFIQTHGAFQTYLFSLFFVPFFFACLLRERGPGGTSPLSQDNDEPEFWMELCRISDYRGHYACGPGSTGLDPR